MPFLFPITYAELGAQEALKTFRDMKRFYYFMLALMLALLPSTVKADDVPYAALYVNATDTLLHFTYGGTPSETIVVTGTTYYHYDNAATPEAEVWYWNVTDTRSTTADYTERTPSFAWSIYQPQWERKGYHRIITKVVFDASFQYARPKSCAFWFRCEDTSVDDISATSARWISKLRSIEGLEYLNTSEVVTMFCMFQGCKNLNNLDVSHFDTSKCKSFWGMFSYCFNLNSLDVSNFDGTSAVQTCGMFAGCSSLTSLDIGNINTVNATDMFNMFYGCSSLTSLDVGGLRTDKATNLGGMFEGCSNLVSIEGLNSFDTHNATSFFCMFKDCSSLITLDLRSFSTENLKSLAAMFSGCNFLTRIYVSNTWSNIGLTGQNATFLDCARLVGGMGTACPAKGLSSTWARVDTKAAPGYFTCDYDLTIPADGVSTLYLPYTVEIPDADWFVAATVKAITYNESSGSVTATMKQIKKGIIPAYTGVFIQANPGVYTMKATIETTDETIVNLLHGTLEETRLADLEYGEGAKNGYANKQERVEDCDDEDYALYFVQSGKKENFGFKYLSASKYEGGWYNDLTMTVPANKAYLKLDYNTNEVLAKTISISFGGGEETAIEDVEVPGTKANDGIFYNLNGQRVSAPVKGIYIKNGKKVFMK